MFSKLFSWLKKERLEEWAKKLCLMVLEKMPDEYSVYREELNAGIIGRIIPDLHSVPCRYNVFFDTSVSEKYERKIDLTNLQVNVENVQKVLQIEKLPEDFWKEFQSIHEKYPQINISEICQVNLDGRCIYHLFDIGDGDFVGYEMSNGFVKVCHDDSEIISNIPNLDEYIAMAE